MADDLVINPPVVRALIADLDAVSTELGSLGSSLTRGAATQPIATIPDTLADRDSLLRRSVEFALKSLTDQEQRLGKRAKGLSASAGDTGAALTNYLTAAQQLDADGVVNLNAAQARTLPPLSSKR